MKKIILSCILLCAFAITSTIEAQRGFLTPVRTDYCSTPSTTNPIPGHNPTKYIRNSSDHCFKIYVHVINKTDTTGGVTTLQVQEAIQFLNQEFSSADISFNWDGSTNEINDTDLFFNPDNILDHSSHTDGIDIYFGPTRIRPSDPFMSPGGGFTDGSGVSSALYIFGGTSDGGLPLIETSIFPHEMGHVLGLYHTHETTEEIAAPAGKCKEYVNNSRLGPLDFSIPNGVQCGDFVMDTPADPDLRDLEIYNTCSWTPSTATNPLNITDFWGDIYNPDETNIMSYAPVMCTDQGNLGGFTNGQISRMKFAIENLTHLQNALCGATGCNWLKNIGSSSGTLETEGIRTLTTDSNGNVYVVGNSSGNIEFEGINFTGTTYLIKFNPSGCLVWIKDISQLKVPTSIEINNFDELILFSREKYSFNGPPVSTYPFTTEYYLTKLDSSNGNIVWENTISNIRGGSDEYWMDINSSNGNIYLLLNTHYSFNLTDQSGFHNIPRFSDDGFNEITILRFNGLGIMDWSKSVHTNLSHGYPTPVITTPIADNMTVSENDDIYITTIATGGYTYYFSNSLYSMSIPQSINPTFERLTFLIKINSNSNLIQHKVSQSTYYTAIEHSSSQNLLYSYKRTMSLANPATHPPYLVTLDSNLNEIQTGSIPFSNEFWKIYPSRNIVEHNGNIFISTYGNNLLWVGKINISNHIVWYKSSFPTNSNIAKGRDISVYNNKLFVGGHMQNDDMLLENNQFIPHNGGIDGFLLRVIDEDNSATIRRNSLKNKDLTIIDSENKYLSLFPNPFDTQLTLKQDQKNPIVQIIIYDKYGNILLSQKTENTTSEVELNTSQLSKGIYFIKTMYTNGKSEIKQIIK